MIQNKLWIFKFSNLKFVKKIILTGCCIGIVLILINMGEVVNENSFAKIKRLGLQKWMEDMNLKMDTRRHRMEKSCKLAKLDIRGKDALHKPNEWEFVVNRDFKLIWCNVFKAASTSWIYNFNVLAGYTEDFLKKSRDVPIQLLRRKYPRPSLKDLEKALSDSVSFIIVRHPFERLLSAYRDKIENSIPHSLHHTLGLQILMNYRKGVKDKINNSCFFNLLKKAQKKPTFSEFVNFLIDFHSSGKTMDEHWIPITNFCTPCQVRFDVIMKFETLEDDQKYLIKRLNLQGKIRPQWQNPTKGKQNLTTLIEKYYSQLNSTQIFKLYQIYRHDFYLFEYNVDKFLKYIIPSDLRMISTDLKKYI